jgi:hypothetical protein
MAAQQPARAAVAVLVILLGMAAVAAMVEIARPAGWGTGALLLMELLAALVLFGSVAEFLLPVTYTLDASGAHARHLGSHRVLPWARVRRVYQTSAGVKLSPLPASGWAEGFRGVLLRTRDREAVLATIRAWLTEAGVPASVVEEA